MAPEDFASHLERVTVHAKKAPLVLVAERGYGRDRDLLQKFDGLLKRFRG